MHLTARSRATRPGCRLLAALVVAVLAGACAHDGGAAATDTAGDRAFDGPLEDWLQARAECLRASGWEVDVDPDAGTLRVPDVPPGGSADFDRDNEECTRRIGRPPAPRRLSDEEVRAAYDALLETARCLESEGHEVAEAPPFDQFLASWETGPWHPYRALAGQVDPAEFERLNRACPQPGG